MAGFNTSALTAYTDEMKSELIREAILKGTALKYVSKQRGCKSDTTIDLLNNDSTFQAGGGCNLTAAGSTAYTQRTIVITKIADYDTFCPDQLEAFYTQKYNEDGSYHSEQPVETLLADQKIENTQAYLDDLAFRGDSSTAGNLGLADGYIKAAQLDTTVKDLGSLTFSASNIIAEMDSMVALLDTDILAAGDLTLFIGFDHFSTYRTALIDANKYTPDYTSSEQWVMDIFRGNKIKVVATRGLNGVDKVILTPASNLWYGYDLENDYENFKFWLGDDGETVKFLQKFKVGFQHAIGKYLVLGQ